MALTPDQEAAFTRLEGYNGNGYNPTSNPLGFARGGNQLGVFVQALRDVAITGRFVGAFTAIAEQLEDAIGAIEEGPVISVMGQTGVVVGLVEEAQFAELAETLTTDVANAIAAIDPRALTIALAIAYTGGR